MSKFATVALAAALTFCAQGAAAAVVLDQSSVPETGIVATGAAGGLSAAFTTGGQSFTVGVAGLLDHIDIGLFSLVNVNAGVPVSLKLLDNAGAVLVSQTYAGTAIPRLQFGVTPWSSMLRFDLSPFDIRVAAGDVLRWSVTAPGAPALMLLDQTNNVFFSYGGGSALASFSAANPGGLPFSADHAFRTYVDTTAAPEPGAWALMLLGFGAVGAALRARRPAAA